MIENKGKHVGGISLSDSEANITNSTLTGNEGVDSGALLLYWNCHVTTAGCHFLENIASDKGAAVLVNNQGEYEDCDGVFTENVGGGGGKIL